MSQPGPADLILHYDGVCGFCNQSVQSILKYDKRGTMRLRRSRAISAERQSVGILFIKRRLGRYYADLLRGVRAR